MTVALAFAALTAAILGLLLIPLVRRPRPPLPRAALDGAIFRDRLQEIDREVERGVIGPAEAEASRTEIQRRLLAVSREPTSETAHETAGRPRWTIAAIVLLIPAGAFALYLKLGSPAASDYPFAARRDTAVAAHAGQGDSMEPAVESLAQRLRNRPDDLEGWLLLARSYMSMERYGDAAKAYRQAMTTSNNRPDIATDYAEVLFVMGGSAVTAEARAILEAAYAADPLNPKARYYLGVAMAERGDLRGALQAWVDLVHLSPKDAPWVPAVREQIASAASDLGVETGSIQPSAEAVQLARGAHDGEPPPREGVVPPLKTEDAEAIAALPEAERGAMIRSMVERLAQRLKDNPGDREGWLRLARAYEVLGEPEKAKEARSRAGAPK